MSVLTGIDVLAREGYAALAGKRVGLLTNPSGVTRGLRQTVDLFRGLSKSDGRTDAKNGVPTGVLGGAAQPHPRPLSIGEGRKATSPPDPLSNELERGGNALPFELAALFTPEHGLYGAVLDGEFIETTADAETGTPIYSLYGETFAPTREMLDDLDVIVCDIQDIGVRYYTYAWTITHVIEAAGMAQIPVILLDRPNPLGGAVDGARLDMTFASLVGRIPIPVQHGMTLGEVMVMFNALWNPNPAEVSVIACEGYARDMAWEQTWLHFVTPSPAMPHVSTARQYPGACLIEGTNLSEGRGTALPFEICGAPFIDEGALADHLNALNVPGVWYRPHVFQPSSSKFAGQVCRGIQAHVTGGEYRSMLAWMQVIAAVRDLYPDDFAFKPGTFDRLYGDDQGRTVIEAGKPVSELVAAWDEVGKAFMEQRREYLIYS